MRETETKKREHLKALEEQAKKGAKMEDEFKSLQSNASTFNILLKDACKQAELFGCEKVSPVMSSWFKMKPSYTILFIFLIKMIAISRRFRFSGL